MSLNSSQLDTTLLKLQKRFACLIFSCNRLTRSKPLFTKLNWLLLHQRIEHNTCILMFKINNNIASSYLTEMFKKVSDVHSYNTRSAKSGLYTNRGAGNYYTKTFKYFGTKLCSALPAHLHTCRTFWKTSENSVPFSLWAKLNLMNSSHMGGQYDFLNNF